MRRKCSRNPADLPPVKRQTLDLLQSLVRNLDSAAFLLDTDGKFIVVNKKAQRITGLRQEDHCFEKSIERVAFASESLRAVRSFKDAVKGKSRKFALRRKRKGSKHVVAEVKLKPCTNREKTVGILGTARYVSQRSKIQRRPRDSDGSLAEMIMEKMSLVAVQGFDREFKTIRWNKASTRFYGLRRQEALGRKAHGMVLSKKCAKEFEELLEKTWRSGVAVSPGELAVEMRNGEHRWIYFVMFPLFRQGKVAEVICTSLDLTERKMLEKRLSALNSYAGRLNAAGSRQQIYELTLDVIERTFGFEDAAFLVAERNILLAKCRRGRPGVLSQLPLDGSMKGVTVRAATTRSSVIVPNVRTSADYVESNPKVRSEIAVPVEIEGRALGVLDVGSRKLNAFNEEDVTLLQILASHAATAISNLEKRQEIEKRSNQLGSLMRSSAEMIHSTDLHQRLQKIAEAMVEHGWRRVVIRAVRGKHLEVAEPEHMVTAGLTSEERSFLWNNKVPGTVWRERFGGEYERFKIGEFYHLPWNDPWVREKFSKGSVPSKLSRSDMVDWNPEDLLYAPLRLADGRIVGVLSIDDPVDGRRPTKESLAPLELFIHQAAVAIENAQLFQELKDAKNEVREYADRLEVKVRQRTRELEEAQKRLIKAERLAVIGEIAAMVGHDLRNPLTGITGAAYYLKMKLGPVLSKRSAEMFEIIERDISYSNKIIDDLLEYSREIRLEPLKTVVWGMVDEALLLVKVPENVRVVRAGQRDATVRVDVDKMKRVFVNMVRNAVDAMPDGGTLAIRVRESGDDVEVTFEDTGTGMSREVMEQLWSPLFTTKARGMGFGLPICKRVVEAHGGRIRVQSKFGKGTAFTVTLHNKKCSEGVEKPWVSMPESLSSTMTRA